MSFQFLDRRFLGYKWDVFLWRYYSCHYLSTSSLDMTVSTTLSCKFILSGIRDADAALCVYSRSDWYPDISEVRKRFDEMSGLVSARTHSYRRHHISSPLWPISVGRRSLNVRRRQLCYVSNQDLRTSRRRSRSSRRWRNTWSRKYVGLARDPMRLPRKCNAAD